VWRRLGVAMHRPDSTGRGLAAGGHVLGLNGVGRAVGATYIWFVFDIFDSCAVWWHANPIHKCAVRLFLSIARTNSDQEAHEYCELFQYACL
jgi:hypothetical protein